MCGWASGSCCWHSLCKLGFWCGNSLSQSSFPLAYKSFISLSSNLLQLYTADFGSLIKTFFFSPRVVLTPTLCCLTFSGLAASLLLVTAATQAHIRSVYQLSVVLHRITRCLEPTCQALPQPSLAPGWHKPPGQQPTLHQPADILC